MKYILKQHIYTSSGGRSFETVAISPDVSAKARAILEAQASRYSGAKVSESPPLIFRAFYMSSEDSFAISLLVYTGASFDRSGGNYLAHSYIIPKEVAEEAHYNLAWIAAHLPIATKYRPQNPYGADRLEPYVLNIEMSKQYDLFIFLIREIGEDAVYELIDMLVQHLSQTDTEQTLVLKMPPPHESFQKVYAETQEDKRGISSNQDFLRLLRLAAAFTILPNTFSRNATFCVNELRPPSQANAPDQYALTLLRDPSDETGRMRQWPWLRHCFDLAYDGNKVELRDLSDRLSNLLPADRRPSRKGIDAGYSFFKAIDVADDRAISGFEAAGLIRAFTGVDFEAEVLHDEIIKSVKEDDRLKVLIALWEASVKSSKPLSDKIINSILSYCKQLDDQSAQDFRRILLSLPATTQAQVWGKAVQSGEFPARISTVDGKVKLDELSFVLATYNPTIFPEHSPVPDRMLNTIEGLLRWRMVSQSTAQKPSFNYSDLILSLSHRGISGEINPELIRALARRIAPKLAQDFWANGTESIISLIKDYLYNIKAFTGLYSELDSSRLHHIIASVIMQAGAHARMDFTTLFWQLHFKEAADREPTLQFLSAAADEAYDNKQRRFINVLIELVNVLNSPLTKLGSASASRRLPYYAEWVEIIDGMHDGRKSFEYIGLHKRLESYIEGFPIDVSIAMAASYFRLNPKGQEWLFNSITNRIFKESYRVAEWALSKPGGWHLSSLAELTYLSRKCDRSYRKAFERTITDVVLYIKSKRDRTYLIAQLRNQMRHLDRDFADELADYLESLSENANT